MRVEPEQKRNAAAAPRKDPRWGDTIEFLRVLWELDHGLQVTSKRMQATLGVTGPQRLVVRVVGRMPNLTAGELAAVLHMHPSTLTGILQRLESSRALQRHIDPADRRRVRFTLTAQGRSIDDTRGGTVEAAVRRGLARVSEAEVRAAKKVLRVVTAALREAKG